MTAAGRLALRCAVVLLLCGVGTVVLAGASTTSHGSVPLSAIPVRLGAWEGQDLEVDDRTKALLGTDQVVLREYRDPDGMAVWMAVVYAAENRSAFHPPELCYTGSNFELLERRRVAVTTTEEEAPAVNRLLLTNGQQRLVAYYWFTAGDRLFTDYHHQQVRLIWDQMRHQPSNGTLVRVSTLVDGEDVDTAEHRLAEMATLLITAMRMAPERYLDSATR